MDTRHLIAYLLIGLMVGVLAAALVIGHRRRQERRATYRGRRNSKKF